MEKTTIFALSASRGLAEEICQELDLPLGNISVNHFADKEILVTPMEAVRGKHVYLVQSTNNPVNDNLMELMIAIDSLKRASAKSITAIIPYFGYARQDRKAAPRQPITAKLVASLIERAGADRVVTIDLHAAQIQGFFDIPVDDIAANNLIGTYFKHSIKGKDTQYVVVSPDHGGAVRARKLAEYLHAPMAIIDKRRPKPNVAVAMNLIGDVAGKEAIIIDDMVDTGGTISSGVQMLKEHGATAVNVACSHAILSGPAIERLRNCGLKEFVCTNTIDQSSHLDEFPEMKIISVAPLMARLIRAVEYKTSLSAALKSAYGAD